MRTWWRFLQKRVVGTKFDIYVFFFKNNYAIRSFKGFTANFKRTFRQYSSVMILLISLYSQFVSINVCLKLFYAAKYTNKCLDIIMYLCHC